MERQKVKNLILILQSLIIIVLIGIVIIQEKPKYIELIDVENEEHQELILSDFKEKSIEYKMVNNTISVSEVSVGKSILVLNAYINLDQPDHTINDVMGNTSFTMTSEFREQQILQAKATSIKSGIEYGVEWINDLTLSLYIPNVPSGHDYDSNIHGKSLASLSIELKEGYTPTKEDISALKNYIVKAVEYLDIDDIYIIDSYGNNLCE